MCRPLSVIVYIYSDLLVVMSINSNLLVMVSVNIHTYSPAVSISTLMQDTTRVNCHHRVSWLGD